MEYNFQNVSKINTKLFSCIFLVIGKSISERCKIGSSPLEMPQEESVHITNGREWLKQDRISQSVDRIYYQDNQLNRSRPCRFYYQGEEKAFCLFNNLFITFLYACAHSMIHSN